MRARGPSFEALKERAPQDEDVGAERGLLIFRSLVKARCTATDIELI